MVPGWCSVFHFIFPASEETPPAEKICQCCSTAEAGGAGVSFGTDGSPCGQCEQECARDFLESEKDRGRSESTHKLSRILQQADAAVGAHVEQLWWCFEGEMLKAASGLGSQTFSEATDLSMICLLGHGESYLECQSASRRIRESIWIVVECPRELYSQTRTQETEQRFICFLWRFRFASNRSGNWRLWELDQDHWLGNWDYGGSPAPHCQQSRRLSMEAARPAGRSNCWNTHQKQSGPGHICLHGSV